MTRLRAMALVLLVAAACGGSDTPSCGTTCPGTAVLSLVATVSPVTPVPLGAAVTVTASAAVTAPGRVDSLVCLVDGVRSGALGVASGSFTIRPTVLGTHFVRVVAYGTGTSNSPLQGAQLSFTAVSGQTVPGR